MTITEKCRYIDGMVPRCFGCNYKLSAYKAPQWQSDRATHVCHNCGARYKLVKKCLKYIRTIEKT